MSDDSASSATSRANAARSLTISSTDSRPTIARSEPASTSWVNGSISPCWPRKRWAAARTASSVPPTLTIATPSSEQRMPCADTAEPTEMPIWRDDRSSTASFWTTGSTNVLAPITTFWPDRSVEIAPVSGLVTARPLRPVTMNASFGPATLKRLATSTPIDTTRAASTMTKTRTGLMTVGRSFRWVGDGGQTDGSVGQAGARHDQNSVSVWTRTFVGDSTAMTTTATPDREVGVGGGGVLRGRAPA